MNISPLEQGTIRAKAPNRSWTRAGDFATAFQGFMLSREVQNCTQSTLETYEKRLGKFFVFLQQDGCHTLKDIQRTHIELYLVKYQQKGCSPFYVDSHYRTLKAFFRWCVGEEYIIKDPLRNIHTPKLPKLRKPFLTTEQFQSMLALCPLSYFWGARNAAILWLLWTTGLRLHEAANIQLRDIEWGGAKKRGSIRIMGKGQKERYVPLLPRTKQALWRYQSYRTDEYPQLWLTEEGRPATKAMINMVLTRLQDRAGLKGLIKDRCHVFRRSWAWRQIQAGVPEKYILLCAGWSSRAMLDRYVGAASSEQAVEAQWKE
jgi:site-specific recombinase XerD